MSRLQLQASLLALAILGINCGLTTLAQPPLPPDAATATSLQVRYAGARLRLARVDLEMARIMNDEVSGSVSPRELRRLETNFAVALKQLDIAREYTHGSTVPTQLSAAEAFAKLADRDYRAALEVNKNAAGTVSEVMVKRLHAKAELAKIRVECWKDPAYLPSLMDEMQWQIDRLTEQVIELSQRVESMPGQ